ncbi:FAD-dependent oxidoreductase [Aneurinibacillus sp. Ricciae_BoGa-3]|uniref:dihydrolipoyl dehydrogenase family protein n=1 Tax=Aneurinibacillus sp. Ricciae_BoGa-3 TaxID=3022697 RepID=UPI0023409DC8|nr:FAD-dependent oxidoreductase [Aneurinibacillus sp. Ricciae_BoGa-3]WCK52954.1 FAD-dependent oxidoreductase [Aneurinibacillus sp. Ricciae_BoGa-3]
MKKYDLIVMGGGAGGLTVAAGAASMGAKIALIEKEEQPGGDCLHFGCIPSKALIESAKKVHDAKKTAKEFNLELHGELDFPEAIRRVKAAIAHIQRHDDADRFKKMGVDVYHGLGRFKDDHLVEISSGDVIYGKRIVISTGSRPVIPPIEGIQEVDYLTNETIFDLNDLPKRLVVVGAGPIGLELAQSFARLGSQVTVIEFASSLLGREDQDMVPFAQEALEKELTFMFSSKVQKVEKLLDGGKRVTVLRGEEEIKLDADEILIATGRQPNTDQIGIENTGVQVDKGCIVVKDTLQTTVPHIYGIGDVLRTFPFTHAAGMEGKIVVGNAVLGLKRKVSYEHVPWVTYIDPEVFHLGLTEQEAREKYGESIRIYKVTLDDVDRFVADREMSGLVKVITDHKGLILGAHAVGKNAGDWMQEIIYAKQHGHKIGNISNVIHPYPTHGAALQRAANQYWRNKLFKGIIPKMLKKYIEWFR